MLDGSCDALDISCGIPELDTVAYGDAVGTVGKYAIYRRDVRTFSTSRPVDTTCDLSTRLEPINAAKVPRFAQNLVLFYEHPLLCAGYTIQALHEKLSCVFKKSALLCVGHTAGDGMLAFVHRTNYQNFAGSLVLDLPEAAKAEPTIYGFKRGGRACKLAEEGLLMVGKMMGVAVTSNMVIRLSNTGEYSFEQLVQATRTLTESQLTHIKGAIECKPIKSRTTFEGTFMRALNSICRVRQNKRMRNHVFFSAFDPPMKVCPTELLTNLGQVGTRLQEISMDRESFTLHSLLCDASIMERYAILIMGENKTTGFGKTQFALRLAIEYAKAKSEVEGIPKDEANILVTNTIDAARSIDFSKVLVWVLDEFEPGDENAIIYTSENIIKCLLTVTLRADLRGRQNDVSVPPGVCRIITSNSRDGQQWVGRKMRFSEPLQRKSVLFKVTSPIVTRRWSESPLTADQEDCADVFKHDSTERISAIMSARARTRPVPAPVERSMLPSCLTLSWS